MDHWFLPAAGFIAGLAAASAPAGIRRLRQAGLAAVLRATGALVIATASGWLTLDVGIAAPRLALPCAVVVLLVLTALARGARRHWGAPVGRSVEWALPLLITLVPVTAAFLARSGATRGTVLGIAVISLSALAAAAAGSGPLRMPGASLGLALAVVGPAACVAATALIPSGYQETGALVLGLASALCWMAAIGSCRARSARGAAPRRVVRSVFVAGGPSVISAIGCVLAAMTEPGASWHWRPAVPALALAAWVAADAFAGELRKAWQPWPWVLVVSGLLLPLAAWPEPLPLAVACAVTAGALVRVSRRQCSPAAIIAAAPYLALACLAAVQTVWGSPDVDSPGFSLAEQLLSAESAFILAGLAVALAIFSTALSRVRREADSRALVGAAGLLMAVCLGIAWRPGLVFDHPLPAASVAGLAGVGTLALNRRRHPFVDSTALALIVVASLAGLQAAAPSEPSTWAAALSVEALALGAAGLYRSVRVGCRDSLFPLDRATVRAAGAATGLLALLAEMIAGLSGAATAESALIAAPCLVGLYALLAVRERAPGLGRLSAALAAMSAALFTTAGFYPAGNTGLALLAAGLGAGVLGFLAADVWAWRRRLGPITASASRVSREWLARAADSVRFVPRPALPAAALAAAALLVVALVDGAERGTSRSSHDIPMRTAALLLAAVAFVALFIQARSSFEGRKGQALGVVGFAAGAVGWLGSAHISPLLVGIWLVAALALWALAALPRVVGPVPASAKPSPPTRFSARRDVGSRRPRNRRKRARPAARRGTPASARPFAAAPRRRRVLTDPDRRALRAWATALGILAAPLAVRASINGSRACSYALACVAAVLIGLLVRRASELPRPGVATARTGWYVYGVECLAVVVVLQLRAAGAVRSFTPMSPGGWAIALAVAAPGFVLLARLFEGRWRPAVVAPLRRTGLALSLILAGGAGLLLPTPAAVVVSAASAVLWLGEGAHKRSLAVATVGAALANLAVLFGLASAGVDLSHRAMPWVVPSVLSAVVLKCVFGLRLWHFDWLAPALCGAAIAVDLSFTPQAALTDWLSAWSVAGFFAAAGRLADVPKYQRSGWALAGGLALGLGVNGGIMSPAAAAAAAASLVLGFALIVLGDARRRAHFEGWSATGAAALSKCTEIVGSAASG